MADRPIITWGGPSGAGGGGGGGLSVTITPIAATIIEIGADLVSPTYTLAEAGAAGPLVTRTLTDDDGNPAQNVLGFINPVTMPFTYNETAVGATRTVTYFADDGTSTDTDVATHTWLPAVYRGVDASAVLATEADIEALATKALAADKTGTFIFTPANEYIYIAFPQAYNPTSPFDFTVNGFPGGFVLQAAGVSVTANTAGAPVLLYDLWRSTNMLTGAPNITVVVS